MYTYYYKINNLVKTFWNNLPVEKQMIGTYKFRIHKYLKFYFSHQILVGSANSLVVYGDFFETLLLL